MTRVLFVSKPIAPPWNDGSKNLVRDVAANLKQARATVMTTPNALFSPRVNMARIYNSSGAFSPTLSANAAAFFHLVADNSHDIWHFVFAPNARSSFVARVAIKLRRACGWRGHVVQTIASVPSNFRDVNRLLFGDAIVALSESTRSKLIAAGIASERVCVIPPCAEAALPTSERESTAIREKYALGNGPIVLYPGDYEVSRGAQTVADAARKIVDAIPNAKIVFACRMKTEGAAIARDEIAQRVAQHGIANCVVQLGDIDDMHALIRIASIVLFPVDNLYGKVDLPLVLLEAMSAKVPIVVAKGGPLEELSCARTVSPGDAASLASIASEILRDKKLADHIGLACHALYEQRFSPGIVAAQYDALYSSVNLCRSTS